MTDPEKAVLAMPSGRGDVRIETMGSVVRTIQHLKEENIDVTFMSVTYAEPAMARNRIAASFLDSDADVLMMLDDDVSIHPTLVLQLLRLNKPFIGVYLPQRQLSLDAFAEHVRSGKDVRAARLAAAPPVGPSTDADGGAFEVSHISGGFLMLRRSVFELIDAAGLSSPIRLTLPGGSHHVGGYFSNISEPDQGVFLSEDYSFCRRYTEAGGKIIAYKGPGVTHHGAFAFES